MHTLLVDPCSQGHLSNFLHCMLLLAVLGVLAGHLAWDRSAAPLSWGGEQLRKRIRLPSDQYHSSSICTTTDQVSLRTSFCSEDMGNVDPDWFRLNCSPELFQGLGSRVFKGLRTSRRLWDTYENPAGTLKLQVRDSPVTHGHQANEKEHITSLRRPHDKGLQ